MKGKECKIVCDGKEIATIKFSEKGFSVECTEDGKKMCKELHAECCD